MSRRHRHLLLTASFGALIAACGSGPGGAPTTGPSATPTQASAEPSPSAAAAPSVSQTDTDWGLIWDAVPAGFPRYPGAAPAEDASAAPSSARYAVSGSDPEAIAAWLQAGMETARFSTDVSGPLEDGSFTLDSIGDADCRIQTTIAPLGGMTFVTVLYGASCPMR